MKNKILVVALVSAFGFNAQAGDISKKLDAALKSDIRSEQEVNRDRNRRPQETLAFFGLQDDMKVVELIPGGGWYTKLLAPVLKDKGEFYVAYGTDRVKNNVLGLPGFEKVKVGLLHQRCLVPKGLLVMFWKMPIWG